MRAKIAASGMGFLPFGLCTGVHEDCKDNENNQSDYRQDEPQNPDDQIKGCNTGENRKEPCDKCRKFTQNSADCCPLCFHFLFELFLIEPNVSHSSALKQPLKRIGPAVHGSDGCPKDEVSPSGHGGGRISVEGFS